MSSVPAKQPSPRVVVAFPGERAARAQSVPHPLTSLIGRERELAAVLALLRESQVRLLTLTGPGGVGKTRLAVEAARELAGEFGDDVVFVPLAPISSPALVSIVIARALGVQDSGNRPLRDQLHEALQRRRLLLILDNFEHVTAAAPMVASLVAACPHLSALITSRERLRVSGEREIPLTPLALPAVEGQPDLAELAHSAAVALFVERASAQASGFALTEENAADIVSICRRLDGLPLAIELAAPWSRMLSPATLLRRLEHRLPLLTGGARDFPARHQTLRDAIAWTYDLLSPAEQAQFRRLSVFAGSFTLEAAEDVGGKGEEGGRSAPGGGAHEEREGSAAPHPVSSSPLSPFSPSSPWSAATPLERSDPPPSLLAVVASLVDKHLIYRADEQGEEPRFGVLETIREFGLEQLASSGEETVTRNAHAAYFSSLIETSEVRIYDLGRPEDLARIEMDHANLRAVLSWLIATGQGQAACRLTGALFWFWFYRSYLTEGRAWLARALSLPADADEPPAIRARALAGAAALAIFQQDLEQAEGSLNEAHDVLRTVDDRRLLGMAQALSALLALFQERFEDVDRHAALAIDYSAPIGDLGSHFRAMFFSALAARGSGDTARAATLLEDLLVQTRQAGATYFHALALQCSSPLLTGKDETHLAAKRYEDALRIFREAGELWSVAACLVGIASVGANQDPGAAARLLGAAAEIRAAVAAPIAPTDRLILEQATSTARAMLGDASFTEAWAAGGQLSLAATLEVASGIVDTSAGKGSDSERSRRLTPRELEVLGLVAAGRTDREIADTLFISINTAMKHVGNILMKLDVESRTAAAAFAHRNGIA